MSDAAAAADVEKAGVSAGGADDGASAGGGGAVGAIVGRWRRQDLLDKSGSALRAAAWAFSLLAFLIMAANEHGDWKQFDHYEEYRCTSRRPAIALAVHARSSSSDRRFRWLRGV